MIPLRDVIPSRTVPVVTISIIVLNALVFALELRHRHRVGGDPRVLGGDQPDVPLAEEGEAHGPVRGQHRRGDERVELAAAQLARLGQPEVAPV